MLREEHRFRLFENRVPRMFEHKMEEVARGWLRLHHKEFHNIRNLQGHKDRWGM